jgi:hypothetical protein
LRSHVEREAISQTSRGCVPIEECSAKCLRAVAIWVQTGCAKIVQTGMVLSVKEMAAVFVFILEIGCLIDPYYIINHRIKM